MQIFNWLWFDEHFLIFIIFVRSVECIVSSLDVVPGDVVIIEAGSVMEVDMVVVEGAVVVTEALLTGESVPTTKVTKVDIHSI